MTPLSRISASKNPSTQTSASRTSSSWISVNSIPLPHLVAQLPPIKSRCPPQRCLCPKLLRQLQFAPQPLPQSQHQHQSHRSTTAVIPSSFPLGKMLGCLTMPTTPTLFALVRRKINLRTKGSAPCQVFQAPTSALLHLMGKLLVVPTSPSRRVFMLAYSPTGKSIAAPRFHAADGYQGGG